MQSKNWRLKNEEVSFLQKAKIFSKNQHAQNNIKNLAADHIEKQHQKK